ncbi:MAG: LysR family transcriptional regulator [Gammaproteobacteria bacterium]|nr:LysR family transcriptional regulator [Gammaproteobacteria bacterium]
MKLTLRQLEVFLAIAHFENVTLAVNSLALSQSAASTALKELEHRFGISLFDRIGKRLQLNELGQRVRPRAEALLDQAGEFERNLTSIEDVGAIKVGATLTIGNYLAVGIIARFMSLHPESRIDLIVENTRAIAARIHNFELDVGLIEGELQDPELEVLPWRDDELTLFCAPDHPFARKQTLSDEDLLCAKWIVRETGSGTRQAFDRAMTGLLSNLDLLLELQHTEGIKRAVEANLGIGCLSRITLEEAFRRGSLVPLEAPHRNWQRKFYFIMHRQKFRTSGIDSWLALCRDIQTAEIK